MKEFVIHKRVFCLLSDKISVISALFRKVLLRIKRILTNNIINAIN